MSSLQCGVNIVTTWDEHFYNVNTTLWQLDFNIVSTWIQHCDNLMLTLSQREYNIVTTRFWHCLHASTTLQQLDLNISPTLVQIVTRDYGLGQEIYGLKHCRLTVLVNNWGLWKVAQHFNGRLMDKVFHSKWYPNCNRHFTGIWGFNYMQFVSL